MAIQFQLRRGTTVQNNAFVGAEGEITVDTEKHAIRIHDGVTPGGYTQDFVTESWISEDGLSWYRKYASGWVEQGGIFSVLTGGSYAVQVVTLPIEMKNTSYTIMTSCTYPGAGDTSTTVKVDNSLTTTQNFSVRKNWQSTGGGFHWQVSGVSA